MKAFLFLILAIGFELGGTIFLKKSEGFTNLFPSLISLIGFGLALYFFSITIKSMSVGLAYAIWCGLGIVFIAVVSNVFFHQKIDFAGIIGLSLIIAGIIIINLFSKMNIE